MVMYVNKKGINKSTYKQRCDILCEILEKTEPKLGCLSLLCNTTIGHISRQILKNYNPTFIERNICDQICTNKQRTFAVLSIRLASLLHKSFNEEIVEDICLHSQRKCETAGCAGFVTKELSLQGEYILFEIYSDELENSEILLKRLPTTLLLSITNYEYKLHGIVAMKLPAITTRRSNDEIIGHYTAICYKQGTWVEYDDTAKSTKKLNNQKKILSTFNNVC
ncbi:uncharacterized protein LOC120357584 [Solenopsis invicta]|uniref:uncharacterized protein LOC120357584 n=1 Tax=Solenopsis invicta TaxID=13686 RepID=UPI00193D80ED|nr:uncharacterized protein LOC120357584 [Solenopsis invicta]XP_039304330.1 uncharacterized protein LOC120357584 [Solenopsis invicta]